MASSDNKTGSPDRRVSARNSVRVSMQGGDEEYELVAGAISDGFRPLQTVTSATSATVSTPGTSSSTLATVSTDTDAASSVQPPQNNRPSSIAKPPRPHHDSLSLRHDGGMGPITGAMGAAMSGGLSRNMTASTNTTAQYIRPEEPYQGPSGPSHPYQMYPQNVRARTLSVATSSTTAATETSYNGPRGPTHPYGMYPQAITPEASAAVTGAIPVGFNNVGAQYQRRIGPEGEEIADMIGPDGHTEQLPPYTRYPEEAYARKTREVEHGAPGAAPGMVSAGITSSTAVATTPAASMIPGAGGLGLATRNPEFESTDDLGSPQSRHSARSFPVSSSASQHEINMAAVGISEKSKPLKPWQIWMRKRAWNIIPYWAICLTLGVLILMAIILGAVVGTLFKHKKPPNPKADADSTFTTTVTYDASPIPTPTDLPPLATGSFALPLMSNRVSSTCFNDTQQSQAWTCSIVPANMYLNITKNGRRESPGDYTVTIGCNQSYTFANNFYSYGEQPPLITEPVPLELVTDSNEPNRGPAWFRMLAYNKTVLIPEPLLQPQQSDSQKRDILVNSFGMNSGEFKRKGVAQVGERPWLCTWPDTFIELFIYAGQNSSWNRPTMPSGSGPPPNGASMTTTGRPSNTDSATTTTTTSTGTNTNTGTGTVAQATSVFVKNGVTFTTTFMPTTTTTSFGASAAPAPPQQIPPYPRVIKLEERRMDGSPQPSCIQVELYDPNSPPRPYRDKNGKFVTITIAETEPPPPGTVLTNSASSDVKKSIHNRETGSDISQCGCMWFVT